jgi:hypothetical protein
VSRCLYIPALVVLALVMASGCTSSNKTTSPPSLRSPILSRELRLMGLSLHVPANWTSTGSAPLVVLRRATNASDPTTDVDDGTITVEPFLGAGGHRRLPCLITMTALGEIAGVGTDWH